MRWRAGVNQPVDPPGRTACVAACNLRGLNPVTVVVPPGPHLNGELLTCFSKYSTTGGTEAHA